MKISAPFNNTFVIYDNEADTIEIKGLQPFAAKHACSEICELFGLSDRTETILPFYPGRYANGEILTSVKEFQNK